MFKCEFSGFSQDSNILLDFFQAGAQCEFTMLKDHDEISIPERSEIYFFGQAGWAKHNLNKIHKNKQKSKFEEILHSANKILQRGDAPYLPLSIDKKIRKMLDLEDSENPDFIRSEWVKMCEDPQLFKSYVASALWRDLSIFIPDQNLKFNSVHEEKFYLDVCPKLLHPKAPHFLFREVSINSLVSKGLLRGDNRMKEQHVDFVYFNPVDQKKYVIEIDRHGDDKKTGTYGLQRRQILEKSGFEVLNVFNHEIEKGEGPSLEALKQRWSEPSDISEIQYCLIKSWLISGLVARGAFSIINLILENKLDSHMGFFEIDPQDKISKMSFDYAQQLVQKISELHGFEKDTMPIRLKKSGNGVSFTCSLNDSPWSRAKSSECFLCVGLSLIPWRESNRFKKPSKRSFFPMLNIENQEEMKKRKDILRFFLNLIFRYEDFRKHQVEAINLMLSGEDALVLLPTSAGKSLVYQLCSIVTPGSSICVFPLVALIDDQGRGLYSFGIDRFTLLHQRITQKDKNVLESFSNHSHLFCLVSPERFQIKGFRALIKKMNFICNYSIVDESHCVSEWGHDFRFSYFHLSKNLRKYTRNSPIIGLTGTSSPQVVADMTSILDLSLKGGKNIIRPLSPKRPELKMKIKSSQGSLEKREHLIEAFKELKKEYKGQWPCAGLVFFQRARSYYEDLGAREILHDADFWKEVGIEKEEVGIYAGENIYSSDEKFFWKTTKDNRGLKSMSDEEWADEKYETFKDFHAGKKKIILCTNAFGMGIDKSDIRFTIHFGMSTSLESFYQEAGRAGRDQKEAYCYILWNKGDDEHWENYINTEHDFSTIKTLATKKSKNENTPDIKVLFWKHQSSWQGESIERKFYFRAYREFIEYCRNTNSSRFHLEVYRWPSKKGAKRAFPDIADILRKTLWDDHYQPWIKKLGQEELENQIKKFKEENSRNPNREEKIEMGKERNSSFQELIKEKSETVEGEVWDKAEKMGDKYIQKMSILGLAENHYINKSPIYYGVDFRRLSFEEQRENLKSFMKKLGVGFWEQVQSGIDSLDDVMAKTKREYFLMDRLTGLAYNNIEKKRRQAIITSCKAVERFKNDSKGFSEKVYSYLGSSKEQPVLELSIDSGIGRDEILSRIQWWIDEDDMMETIYQCEKNREDFKNAALRLRDENPEESLFHFLYIMTNLMGTTRDRLFDIINDVEGFFSNSQWDEKRLGSFDSFCLNFFKIREKEHQVKIPKTVHWRFFYFSTVLEKRLNYDFYKDIELQTNPKEFLIHSTFEFEKSLSSLSKDLNLLKLDELSKKLEVI